VLFERQPTILGRLHTFSLTSEFGSLKAVWKTGICRMVHVVCKWHNNPA